MAAPIPEVAILRLPLYFRVLTLLEREKTEMVSSQELGARLQITPAQIRKDLSYFGRFGTQGKGYNVSQLLSELRQILGLDRKWSVVLVGAGRLGTAILDHSALHLQDFQIVAAFDTDPRQIGKKVRQLTVRDIAELGATVKDHGINIGIIAVPPSEAQEAINSLVGCGIRSILNYAPIAPQVPRDVRVYNIDPVVALQSLAYHLKSLSAP